MLPDEQPVDYILDSIDAEMEVRKQPKVILFDIGGVVVLSPFQSILDYELSLGIPPGWINFSISKTAPNGFWHRLETGNIPLNTAFFDGFNKDLHDPGRWEAFYKIQQSKDPGLPKTIPPIPDLDGEFVFNDMMSKGLNPDPWMLPAVKSLKTSGKYIIAALSNTINFPSGHKLHRPDFYADPIRSLFDVFISSAHVGIRKPNPEIYLLAAREVDRFARENAPIRGVDLGWENGIKPEDILFLDDIGENLKAAKAAGFRTIKVPLGKAFEAVDELESITGLNLAGDHPKIAIKPKMTGPKAKM